MPEVFDGSFDRYLLPPHIMGTTYPAVFVWSPVLSIDSCHPSQPSFWIGWKAVKLQPTTSEKSIATIDSTTLDYGICMYTVNCGTQIGCHIVARDVVMSQAEPLLKLHMKLILGRHYHAQ